jgi:acyl-CoA thioester hydrolase
VVFETVDHVMFGDTDASGLGHFAAQVLLLERAEYAFMEHVGAPPREWFLRRYLFPRVRLEVNYSAPLRFADTIQFAVQVGHLGRTSYSLAMRITNLTTGREAMDARMVIAVLDVQSERPVPVPEELRQAFQPYLVD